MGRVLVADDETHIVQVLALKFRNAGHDVLEASDGEEALQLAREYTPDVIVTDVQMPFMNGIELAGALLADSRLCNLPVLVLTARGWSMDESLQGLSNVRTVLSKPFSPREVLATVEQLMLNDVGRRAA